MELFEAVESLTCCIRYLTQLKTHLWILFSARTALYYMVITYFFEIVLSSISLSFVYTSCFPPLMLHVHVIQILLNCYLK